MKKVIIIGAGFAGTTIAYLLKQEGYDCTVIEKKDVIGGGCRTHFFGGHPFTYGPRPYYGYSEKIFNWIDSFVKLRKMPLYLLSYVEKDNRFYNYPIHEDDINQMPDKKEILEELAQRDNSKEPDNFETYWIQRVGKRLYDKFVNTYSKKMWQIESNKLLDTFNWSAKDEPIQKGSKQVYKDSIIAYPYNKDGYNQYFEKMLEGSTLIKNNGVKKCNFDKKEVSLEDGTIMPYDLLISSMPIEELCDNKLGELPYIGRDFIKFVLPTNNIFPEGVKFCHYTGEEPYTRIVEYKQLTYHKAEDTLLVMELPSNKNKLYPYMIKKYINRAQQYIDSLPEEVYSIGRLGTYKYSTIEQTISQCFEAYRKITGKSIDGLENEFYKIGDIKEIKSRK